MTRPRPSRVPGGTQHRSPNPDGARHRAPPNTAGGRPPSDADIAWALSVVESSGVLAITRLVEPRPARTVTLLGLLVAALTTGYDGKPMHLRCIAAELNAMSPAQLERLGIRFLTPERTYKRVSAKFGALCRVLDTAPEITVAGSKLNLGPTEFANLLLAASLPAWARTSTSRAIDGTDIESSGRFSGQVILDGDSDEDDEPMVDRAASGRRRKARPKAVPFGTGPDGRNIYTADPDARATHRSATDSRPAGLYVGYELHAAVQVPEIKWTDGIERTKIGVEVPAVITAMNLTPGGHHRGEAAVSMLDISLRNGDDITEILVDGGYSRSKPDRFHYPVRQMGIDITMPIFESQRGHQQTQRPVLLIDGAPFSPHLPADLQGIVDPQTGAIEPFPMPPLGATPEVKKRYEAPINARARWRMGIDAKHPNGSTRWVCPFCRGFLAATNLPHTLRANKPTVGLPPEVTSCCKGTITLQADDLPLRQRILFGTTAWRKSYHRRALAESANSGLHRGPYHIKRGYFRIFGRTKHTVLVSLAIAGYNRHRLASYASKHALSPTTGKPLTTTDGPRQRPSRHTPPSRQRVATGRPTSGIPPP